MNRDSIQLAWAGALIGVLALTAVFAAGLNPPAVSGAPGEGSSAAAGLAVGREEASEAAVPVFAEEPEPARRTEEPAGEEAVGDPAAGPFLVALRIPDPVTGERLFVCGEDGCPLEQVLPDADGDAVLGPLRPGRYSLSRGDTEVGVFRLGDNAALTEAEGRLWTDGELLYLERWVCGALRLDLSLPKPGYYSFQLWDENGRKRTADLYIPPEATPDREGRWGRALEFRGLAPGLYTLSRSRTPLLQIEVRAAQTAEAALTVGK